MFSYQMNDEIALCLLTQRDAEALYALIDENRTYLRRWMPWVDGTKSVDDSRAFIKSGLQQLADDAGFHVGIFANNALVGLTGMLPIDWTNKRVEIGYWLREAQQGRGIMTMACRTLIGYIFNELQLHRIEIRAIAGNEKSRAVAERLGFQLEGLQRQSMWWNEQFQDVAVYSLLRDEWSE